MKKLPLLLMLIFGARLAQGQSASPEGYEQFPVRYEVPGMDEVVMQANLVYKSVDDLDLPMDVYRPPDKTLMYPAVIISAGGLDSAPDGLMLKDWGLFQSWGRLIAASGMAAVVFQHRPFERNAVDVQGDVDDALAYIDEHADDLQIDPSRLCFMSFSAFVPFGLTPALRDGARCAVAYYGVMRLDGKANEASSPMTYLQDLDADQIPPLLLTKGLKELHRGLNDTIDEFAEVARERGAEVILLEHPDGGTLFDTHQDDEATRDIVRQTLDFLKLHLLDETP